MDQIVMDETGVSGVGRVNEAILAGCQYGGELTIGIFSRSGDTFPWEIIAPLQCACSGPAKPHAESERRPAQNLKHATAKGLVRTPTGFLHEIQIIEKRASLTRSYTGTAARSYGVGLQVSIYKGDNNLSQ
ncbi:MAG: hypothetical protein EXS39_07960 [Opitutaceae bacterium]|nr:hypothetical protein [Opitutaceae bacterium]